MSSTNILSRGYLAFCLWCFCLFATPLYAAEKFPSKPITIVVPFPPGGISGITAMTYGKYMEKYLGVPVVVDYKPGGGTVVGTQYVVNANPDGYTILNAGEVFTSVLAGTAPYKVEDLTVLAQVTLNGNVLAVRSDAPWKNFQDFVDFARKNPGVKYAHPGVGTWIFFRTENMNRQAKLGMVNVPMKGDAEAVSALIGGHVPVAALSTYTARSQEEAGKVRILLSYDKAEGYGLDPNIPDIESFFKGSVYDIVCSIYLYAPAKTPRDRIEILRNAIEKATKEPGFVQDMKKIGHRVAYMSGEKVMKEVLPKKIEIVREIMKDTGMIK
ncbi:MAG: tripartite tricarboxylate transporter substrate binding protein [candidate division WOR-3 bacterium]